MLRLLKTIKSILTNKPIIVCPCGYRTTSEAKAMKHLLRHPGGVGTLDANGLVVW